VGVSDRDGLGWVGSAARPLGRVRVGTLPFLLLGLVVYSSTLSNVQALLVLLNTATSTDSWGVFKLLPAWAPKGTVAGVGHMNLLSQVNVEEFGALYKINYEIRYSKTGWSNRVYINIAAT